MWCLFVFVTLLTASYFLQDGLSLKLLDLIVPRHAQLHSRVRLDCLFDTEDPPPLLTGIGHSSASAAGASQSTLYSVKWYKDDFEFYRYMPLDEKQITVFKLPGVNVDKEDSDAEHVTLREVSYLSTGTYRCEVSTGAPNFNTALASRNMTVFAWQDRPPWITGIQERYSITEYILANCSSGKSNPAPRLVWHIDNRQPESWYVVESEVRTHDGPLYSRQISLQYPASKLHSGLESPAVQVVTVNCSAWVGDIPRPFVSSARIRIVSEAANQQLSLERLHKNTASPPGSTLVSSAWCLLMTSFVYAVSS